MKIDQSKLRRLIACAPSSPSADELRREDDVFFVGGNLPERQTIETLFDSHYQCNAALFHLTFGDIESFPKAETLARAIKKNFHAHLAGRLDYAAPAHLIERAYAAGVDIIDIPLTSDSAQEMERMQALESARAVFPRWSVVSTLLVGDEPLNATLAAIDALLAREVVPLVTLSNLAAASSESISALFSHLSAELRGKKAAIKPLLPLIYLTTPFAPSASRGGLRGFINAIDDRRLLATSDLRRVLRVKEAEESFASSGL